MVCLKILCSISSKEKKRTLVLVSLSSLMPLPCLQQTLFRPQLEAHAGANGLHMIGYYQASALGDSVYVWNSQSLHAINAAESLGSLNSSCHSLDEAGEAIFSKIAANLPAPQAKQAFAVTVRCRALTRGACLRHASRANFSLRLRHVSATFSGQ